MNVLIITHLSPDMDALVSVYLVEKYFWSKNISNIKIIFSSLKSIDEQIKEWKSNIKFDEIFVVDMPYQTEDKSIKVYDHHYKDCIYKSTAQVLYKELNLKPEYKVLVELANFTDQAKFPPKEWVKYTIPYLLNAFKSWKSNNLTVYEGMKILFNLLVLKEQQNFGMEEQFKKLNGYIGEVGGCKIASYEGGSTDINQWLFMEKNAHFIIFQEGFNQIVQRNSEILEPDLNEFKEYLKNKIGDKVDDYFVHPGGFIFAWGTRKQPADKPAPINFDALVLSFKNFLLERK